MERKPTFLILGAAKCGTTSLYDYLGQHPDVFFSSPKEPIFFEAQYEKGMEFYWEGYFSDWSGESAIGDARTYNLYLPYVPQRIRESLPDARLIVVLREPGDRAYSHWWHRFTRRIEKKSFEEALKENLGLLEAGPRFVGNAGIEEWKKGLYRGATGTRHSTYLDLGYYATQLERYLGLYPREQIKVLLFEDLSQDETALTRELWEFVGVSPEQTLSDAQPKNAAREVVESRLWRFLFRQNQALGFSRLVPQKLRTGARELLSGRPSERPPMAAETRKFLSDHFRQQIGRLEELIERDLSAWRRTPSTTLSDRPPTGGTYGIC